MKLGFDISHWQGVVDFEVAKSKGIEYAFIKAGGASTYTLINYTDTRFRENARKSFGVMPRGFYWYFVPQAGGKKQASYFKNLVGEYSPELPYVVDVEYKGYLSKYHNSNQLREFLNEFSNDEIMIYTSKYAWERVIGNTFPGANQYNLWVANYPYIGWFDNLIESVEELKPLLPPDWTEYKYWQFTEKAPGRDYGVSSHALDLNFTGEEIEEGNGEEFVLAKLLTNLNIRTRPYVSSSSYITYLPKGSVVSVFYTYLDGNNIWLLCKTANNLAGWMAKRYNGVEYMEVL